MRAALLALLPALVWGHGDHTFDLDDLSDEGMSYAERHMHTEHHIDSFDLESFFRLHDLDMNGFWDEAEIEAVYGLHHHSVKENIPQDALRQARAHSVVERVLKALDKNDDGRISLEEFLAGGTDGLPSFTGYKDLGHHYDEESEYFLHHEELYHSSPETQTDEAYNHPEGEPAAMRQANADHHQTSHTSGVSRQSEAHPCADATEHAHIESEEDARERKFEGLPEDADLSQDHVAQDVLDHHEHAPGEGPPDEQGSAQTVLKHGDEVPPPKYQRVDPLARPGRLNQDGTVRDELDNLKSKVQGETYDTSHGRPRSAEERLRGNVPYKYKFRKGLRADEF